jgi:hypothetical protein
VGGLTTRSGDLLAFPNSTPVLAEAAHAVRCPEPPRPAAGARLPRLSEICQQTLYSHRTLDYVTERSGQDRRHRDQRIGNHRSSLGTAAWAARRRRERQPIIPRPAEPRPAEPHPAEPRPAESRPAERRDVVPASAQPQQQRPQERPVWPGDDVRAGRPPSRWLMLPANRLPWLKEPTWAEVNGLPVKDRLELLEQRRISRHQQVNSVALMVGVFFTGLGLVTTTLALRNGQDQLESSRQQQITSRYATAVSDLGAGNSEVRLSALYALQRIGHDSARDRPTIAHVLAAYIRLHAQDKLPSGADPHLLPVDVETAFSILTRPRLDPNQQINLANTDFHGKDLYGLNLVHTNLTNANLSGANLTNAVLPDAILSRADLTGGYLLGATLTRADLSLANLTRANFTQADLTRAVLTKARVGGANFDATQGADLAGTTGVPRVFPPSYRVPTFDAPSRRPLPTAPDRGPRRLICTGARDRSRP